MHEKGGIPYNKIIIGKPSVVADAYNTGTVDFGNLGDWCSVAKSKYGWEAGIFTW